MSKRHVQVKNYMVAAAGLRSTPLLHAGQNSALSQASIGR